MSVPMTRTSQLRAAGRKQLRQQQRDGVGLFAGGAAGAPDADAAVAAGEQRGQHEIGERADLRRVAGEVGLADGQPLDEGLQLVAVLLEPGQVRHRVLDRRAGSQRLRDERGEHAAAGLVDDEAAGLAYQPGDVVQRAGAVELQWRRSSRHPLPAVPRLLRRDPRGPRRSAAAAGSGRRRRRRWRRGACRRSPTCSRPARSWRRRRCAAPPSRRRRRVPSRSAGRRPRRRPMTAATLVNARSTDGM